MAEQPEKRNRGYGNIYTPHAGSMIIQVQRESGLANRTIILSQRQVRFAKTGLYAIGILLIIITASWLYLATQAARVPFLTQRLTRLQHDVRRLDTLQVALTELDERFRQVQHMLGVPIDSPTPPLTLGASSAAALAKLPLEWPLATAGSILPATNSGAAKHGIDIAVPRGTPVRAAGAGVVVQVGSDARYGTLVRIAHRNGYDTSYGNIDSVRVAQGDTLRIGAVIALSGGPSRSLPAHLHFALTRDGVDVDPTPLMNKGSRHGDLRQGQ